MNRLLFYAAMASVPGSYQQQAGYSFLKNR